MTHDYQLHREPSSSGFNLSIGEPVFLREALYDRVGYWVEPDFDSPYPYLRGEEVLLAELRRLHPGRFVVVTCGATQAVQAALFALDRDFTRRHGLKSLELGEYLDVRHEKPYWPRYPTMAERAGMNFGTKIVSESNVNARKWAINVCTAPNNPDGRMISDPETRYDIWDAAYAHSVYGWLPDCQEPRHRISVWSAAKLLGLSASRVGWLVTADPALAQDAALFVEQTISGVSPWTQQMVARVLVGQRMDPTTADRYERARRVLMRNGEIFMDKLLGHCSTVTGVPMHMRGMFAWFRAREPDRFARALQNSGVAVISGEACGYTEPGWYRMSMGQTNEFTDRALTALQEALNE